MPRRIEKIREAGVDELLAQFSGCASSFQQDKRKR